MSLIVQKFGGTSMGNVERIRQVASRVISEKNNNNDVIVVVSAMSGETNRLLNLALEIGGTHNNLATDMVISTGEQVSAGLLSIALNNEGYKAVPMLAHQVKIKTDGTYGNARIFSIDAEFLHYKGHKQTPYFLNILGLYL